MSIRRAKLIDRSVQVRDTSLFVIATEGEKTEEAYFKGFSSPKVQVEVLPTGSDGRCSPRQVLDRLSLFEEKYDVGEGDELWLVSDVDRWKVAELSETCAEAAARGYGLAISNPCFELWLYLHFSDCDLHDVEFVRLVKGKKNNRSAAMEARLRERMQGLGGYQKRNVRFEVFQPHIPVAISRARMLNQSPGDRWPTTFPGTHVYRLVERLLARLPQSLY